MAKKNQRVVAAPTVLKPFDPDDKSSIQVVRKLPKDPGKGVILCAA